MLQFLFLLHSNVILSAFNYGKNKKKCSPRAAGAATAPSFVRQTVTITRKKKMKNDIFL